MESNGINDANPFNSNIFVIAAVNVVLP